MYRIGGKKPGRYQGVPQHFAASCSTLDLPPCAACRAAFLGFRFFAALLVSVHAFRKNPNARSECFATGNIGQGPADGICPNIETKSEFRHDTPR